MKRLPLDYAVRNLARRPLRTALTAVSSALACGLLVATAAFVRGLEGTFAGAADGRTALLLSNVAQRDVVRSSVDAGLAELVRASVPGVAAASNEIHMGTNVFRPGEERRRAGFVRGVTGEAFRVHDAVTLTDGRPFGPGEVLVGRLVGRQLGLAEEELQVGRTLEFEGATWTIAGRFSAPGTTLEAEIWAPLEELRGLTWRDDSSCAFVRLDSPERLPDLDLFTKRRLDLELVMIPSSVYYQELSDYFGPIRGMAWVLAFLIGGAALFGGANTLSAAVQDRSRELATLRAVGYSGWALARSLGEESLLVAAAGGVAGLALARLALQDGAVSLAMSAFALRIDAPSVLVGFGGALLLGLFGCVPAALRASRIPIALALKDT